MTQSGTAAIETVDLVKRFGDQDAVAGISLSVPKGSVFGFLGPNGSGKTTTIRMLLGLAEPTSGTIRVLGDEVPARLEDALPKVGALVEGPAFYPYMSGRKNLFRYDAADRNSDPATRQSRVDAALERVGLTNAAHKKVHAYSLGMKQRLGLANALLKPRQLLILDEPTNGLDPQGTREVRNLIRSLADEGITIFVSSHLLSEIQQVCTHLAVMTSGRIVAQGSLADLHSNSRRVLSAKVSDPAAAQTLLSELGLPRVVVDAEGVQVEIPSDFDSATFNERLVKSGVRVHELHIARQSLEEYFVELTGEGFEVAR